MRYFHRLHKNTVTEAGSYYVENSRKSSEFFNYLKDKI
jgi:hypothetical protein